MEIKLTLEVPKRNSQWKHPSMPTNIAVYAHGDTIKGKLIVDISKPCQHKGITIWLIGSYDMGNGLPTLPDFFTKTLQILPASNLTSSIKVPFSFDKVTLPNGTYHGNRINMNYRIECRVGNDVKVVKQFYFVRPKDIEPAPLAKGIGIANILHIEVILQSVTVDPRVGFIGCVYFALTKMRIVSVYMHMIRIERFLEKNEVTLAKFEVLDGAPVRGTMIPLRFYTGNLDLWPAPKDNNFVIEHVLRLHAVDEKGEVYIRNIPVSFAFAK